MAIQFEASKLKGLSSKWTTTTKERNKLEVNKPYKARIKNAELEATVDGYPRIVLFLWIDDDDKIKEHSINYNLTEAGSSKAIGRIKNLMLDYGYTIEQIEKTMNKDEEIPFKIQDFFNSNRGSKIIFTKEATAKGSIRYKLQKVQEKNEYEE